jgi:hypothetical protein
MDKDELLEELCSLATEVMNKEYNFSKAANCFCGKKEPDFFSNFEFDKEVLAFMKLAVREKLDRNGRYDKE